MEGGLRSSFFFTSLLGLCLVVGAMSVPWGFGLVVGLSIFLLEGDLRPPSFLMSLLVGALSCKWGYVFSLALWT